MGSISKKKESSRSLFYRISAWLHLWLGLITGIVMVIVCLTGCIWVFQEEITDTFLEPESKVAWQDKEVLRPSQLKAIAEREYPGKHASYALYHQGKAVEVNVGGRGKEGGTLKINPYTGQIISKEQRKKGQVNFFRWILNGHRFLWLPYKIGRPIVNYSTLIFVITLITGMVLWWPQKWNKSTRQRSFAIKWNGTVKRVNYDLHNVLGFYSLLFLAAIGMTGMVYGIEWFSKGLYWTTSGGKVLPDFKPAFSDTVQNNRPYSPAQAVDLAWHKVAHDNPDSKGFYMAFPEPSERKATIYVTVYPSADKFYDIRSYTFDQFTLKQIPGRAVFDEPYAKADFGDKLRRMNYDIHVGSILGLPGKVLAFFVSLIGASLPITGFIIWWGKRPKKKKKDSKAKTKLVAAGYDYDKPKPVFKPGGNRPDKTPKPQEPVVPFSPMTNVTILDINIPHRPGNNSADTLPRNGQTD
ncbi:PepSY-associated TM helix domain-containing protein [Spirosoma terrae]|uniref:PepSY domain-containing protein n=1 Tax=Spirosoma terrae TaxID=1968276 RepID=A0A6L9LBI1_9BACT|nr:PepSY-associated TM helix domain-containing protein [Spirosoma terrae]NDU96521.1 PepSY domain-containing protein [Spirosoma terrae]